MLSKFLSNEFEQKQVVMRNDALGRESSGLYFYIVHTLFGRMMFGLKQTAPLLLISMILMLIQGENIFYAFFLMLFVPYQIFSLLRLRFVSVSVCGQCPACRSDITLALEPAERLVLWKYCPTCSAPLKITGPSATVIG